jgi:hypothetical protein
MCQTCVATVEEVVEAGATDRKFMDLYSKVRDKMNNGGYARAYIDLFVHPQARSRRYSMADAWAFQQLSALLWTGKLLICEVGFRDKDSTPARDRDGDRNNQLLSRMVHPFNGWFKGGPSREPGDGMVEWKQPIHLERIIDRGNGSPDRAGTVDRSIVEVPTGSILLEVGNVHDYSMIHRLRGEGGVARWPYGQQRVTILLRHDMVLHGKGEDPEPDVPEPETFPSGPPQARQLFLW